MHGQNDWDGPCKPAAMRCGASVPLIKQAAHLIHSTYYVPPWEEERKCNCHRAYCSSPLETLL